jgi:hypothetical protein
MACNFFWAAALWSLNQEFKSKSKEVQIQMNVLKIFSTIDILDLVRRFKFKSKCFSKLEARF